VSDGESEGQRVRDRDGDGNGNGDKETTGETERKRESEGETREQKSRQCDVYVRVCARVSVGKCIIRKGKRLRHRKTYRTVTIERGERRTEREITL